MKKGDANVFWVLVFAVLALVVLLVLSVIFGKGITNVRQDFEGCTVRGGVCQSSCVEGKEFEFQKENICPLNADKKPQKCCVKLNG
ncbi:hypothetical protein J4207_03935 [Candidatus Woesearchaeota archaeon]|nr:hypothetical protein [Candidatus Woesearchaeota archaeon]